MRRGATGEPFVQSPGQQLNKPGREWSPRFHFDGEFLQRKLALGGNRASGFLVRQILGNIPNPPCSMLPISRTGPLRVSSWRPSTIFKMICLTGFTVCKWFYLSYLVYSTASKAFYMISISQVRKLRPAQEESRTLRCIKITSQRSFRHFISLTS